MKFIIGKPEVNENEPIKFWLEQDTNGNVKIMAARGTKKKIIGFFSCTSGRLLLCEGADGIGLATRANGEVEVE